MHVFSEERFGAFCTYSRSTPGQIGTLRSLFRMLRTTVDSQFLAGSALLLVLLIGLASPGVVHAQDVIVDDDGQAALPQNCGGGNSVSSTIGGGVTNASGGETVFVCPGTYPENVTVNKVVTLEGNNAGTVGNGSRNAESIVDAGSGIAFEVTTTGAVTIDGFQMEGQRGVVYDGSGFGPRNQLIVQNNRFLNDRFGTRIRNAETGGSGDDIEVRENFVDLTQQNFSSPNGEAGTAGISLRTIDGGGAVTVSGNVCRDGSDPGSGSAWYGVIFDGVKLSSGAATISGGSMQDLAQGIAILDGEEGEPLVNTSGGQTPDESDFSISNVSMSGFTGSSSNSAIDFHAGVFVYTGGSPGTQVKTTGNISNITVTGTGTAGNSGGGAPSAGLYFGGFSTEFGSGSGNFDQEVTVTDAIVQDNGNRGVFARGADVVATVERSTITGNGNDPFGNGNQGFGVIAREGGDLTIRQSRITNPSTSSNFGSALQSQDDQLEGNGGTANPVLTVVNSKIERNGFGDLITGQEATNASGSAFSDGTAITDAGTLTGFIGGSQNDYSPFLNSATDTDGSTPGFQGDFSGLILDSGSSDAPSQASTKIEEAVALGGSAEIRLQSTGGEYAIPSDVNVPGTLVVDGGIDFTTGGGTIGITDDELVVTSGASITDSPTFDVQNRFEGEAGRGNDTGWRILASPRASATGSALSDDLDFSTSDGSVLYTWDGASQAFVQGGTGTNLPSGKGFFLYFFDDSQDEVSPSTPVNLNVTGPLDASSTFPSGDAFGTAGTDVTIPATPAGDPGDTGYVLGVPYAQSFDLSHLTLSGAPIGTNGEFKAVVQVWNAANGQFETVTEAGDDSDLIAPWQGFWLLRDQSSTSDQQETLTFESSGRNSGAPFVGKKAASPQETGRLEVELRLEEEGGKGLLSKSHTTLYLREGASTGDDPYDAVRISPPLEEYAQVSLVADDKSRQAQLSLPYGLDRRVTRGLHVEAAGLSGTGVLTLPTWTNVPSGWTITLTDTKIDSTFALTQETEYRFPLTSTKALAKNSDSGPGGGLQDGSVTERFKLTVAPSGTLPVELVAFDGATVENGVQLTWRTASEKNNTGFRIQRKIGASDDPVTADGREKPSRPDDAAEGWETVGSVEGAGTTNRAHTYRFTDAGVPYAAETLRYRLQQVDTDGTVRYSKPVSVERGGPERVALLGTYPNPVRQRATVRFAIPEDTDVEDATLRLYDVLGRSVRTMDTEVTAGRHVRTVDVSGLASGMYVLRLQVGATTKTQKLTIVQ